MFKVSLGSAAIVLAALVTLHAQEDSKPDQQAGYAAGIGSYPVEVVEALTLRDEKRKSDLVVRVHYPRGDGPFPVIVFSHGFGAGKDAFAVIGKHWASHGYVTIHPNHADAGKLAQRKGAATPKDGNKDTDAEKRREELRKRLREQLAKGEQGGLGGTAGLADRVRDLSATIDAFPQIEAKIPVLKGKLDRDRIAVSGHSFGAATTLLIGGVTADIGGESNKSLADPRVKCILPFSAAGTGEYGLTKESWKSLGVPTLFVTGTRDIRPGKTFEWRKEAFEGSPVGDKYLLVLDGATHFQFGGGPPGGGRLQGLGQAAPADKFTPLVKDASTAFWDAYLKGSKSAKQYLTRAEGFPAHAGKVATLSSK
jgi:predicted dienelactone hydrolase